MGQIQLLEFVSDTLYKMIEKCEKMWEKCKCEIIPDTLGKYRMIDERFSIDRHSHSTTGNAQALLLTHRQIHHRPAQKNKKQK